MLRFGKMNPMFLVYYYKRKRRQVVLPSSRPFFLHSESQQSAAQLEYLPAVMAWREGDPGQVASSSQGHMEANKQTRIHIYRQLRVSPNAHVFRLREEAREPGWNPGRHRENMKT